jgi:bifunctional non-homologous end joining protein LigD
MATARAQTGTEPRVQKAGPAWRARLSSATASTAPEILGVPITSPTRPVFPQLGFAKLDLAQYYACVGASMLRYVRDRPLTLVRCEKGATRADALRTECKFLRHESGWHRWAPRSVKRVHIQEQKKVGEYLVVDSLEGLVALAQGDVLEVHCWNATTAHLEQPDRFVFDVDPAPDVAWNSVIDAAMAVRARLAEVGLESWPKLTGGKGVHVVAPFRPDLGWPEVYAVTRLLAESLVRDAPKLFTVDFRKAARPHKILLDYKRNHRGAVAVAAYSPRAVPTGAVSLPVTWDELAEAPSPHACTVTTMLTPPRRAKPDPWAQFWRCRQSLRTTLTRAAKRV